MTFVDDHVGSALKETRRMHQGDTKGTVRYRGRCSCGAQTFMHYSSPDAALVALNRTHMKETRGGIE